VIPVVDAFAEGFPILTDGSLADSSQFPDCRGKVRSSYLGKVESSS